MKLVTLVLTSCLVYCGTDGDDHLQQPPSAAKSMMQPPKLESFFTAEMAYNDQIEVTIPMAGRTGELIGRGDGIAKGDRLNGRITWAFYAEDCAYLQIKKHEEPPVNQHLCKTNPGGFIKTNDGAEIRFDAKGYGFRGGDVSKPHLWRLTAALQFYTEDKRYAWLNTTLGVWEGVFDETQGKASYRAFLQEP